MLKEKEVMSKQYDFDTIIDRKNTSSIKFDFGMERMGREDLLPLWVADMDFKLPDEVLEEVQKAVAHGIFGYTDPKEDYFDIILQWFQQQYNFTASKEWMLITPGVVYAIVIAIRAFTNEGDRILIQQPVYYPFSECVIDNDRVLVNNQLHYENGKYSVDFEDFERKIVEHKVKLFILCNPHNPVGRVWTKEELTRMGEICLSHDVLIVSDEIHADFVYGDRKHYVFAGLSEELKQRCIVLHAPSKTFNIAGLQISNIVVPNEQLRYQFKKEISKSGYSQVSSIGLVAAKAVYSKGYDWYVALKDYLWDNYCFAKAFIEEHIKGVHVVEPEGTYLLWLDFSELGLSKEELDDLIINKAKLWLDAGAIFGKETNQFQRINYACPRSVLEQALRQLEQAIKE